MGAAETRKSASRAAIATRVHSDHADVSRLMLTMFLSPVLVLEALMALLPSYMTSAKAVTMSRPPPGSGHACC